MSTERIRIMMVDDHPIVREGMALFINAQPDLLMCAQAGSAEEALAGLTAARPALVIVDISLHRDSGLDLIKTLRRREPGLGLLALSLHEESIFAERALQAGADGYLMKQEATGNILLAIRRVLAGGIYLSAAMRGRIGPRATAPASPLAGLSEREFEVLQLIGQGYGTRQISEKLNRSVKTIEAHRASLKEKLQLGSATDLLRYAVQWLDQRPPA